MVNAGAAMVIARCRARFENLSARLLAVVAIAILAVMAGAPAQAAAVRGIDFGADEIVLRFDGMVSRASAFVVDGPNRLAIDIPEASAGSGGMPSGPFTAVRHGQFDKTTARVVIELAKPMVVTGGHLSRDGRALVLSVASATKTAFNNAVRTGRKTFASPLALGTFTPPSRGLTVPIGPPSRTTSLKLPAVQGGRSADRPLVVIDAGHGGHDPGAPSVLDDGRSEKTVTLSIARALRDELLSSGRVRVAMTREDDRFLVLAERREIARRLKADLFISIHADSAENNNARGGSVYTLSEVASDRVAAQLAIKENRADILNGVDLGSETGDVSSILIDLTQRETMNISSAFATLLQREMADSVLTRSNYHKFANLMVLKAPDVPSVLIETGYMSNTDDARFLFSRDGQKRIAIAVSRAIEAHFARRLAQR